MANRREPRQQESAKSRRGLRGPIAEPDRVSPIEMQPDDGGAWMFRDAAGLNRDATMLAHSFPWEIFINTDHDGIPTFLKVKFVAVLWRSAKTLMNCVGSWAIDNYLQDSMISAVNASNGSLSVYRQRIPPSPLKSLQGKIL